MRELNQQVTETPGPVFTKKLSFRLVSGLILLIVLILTATTCVLWYQAKPMLNASVERVQAKIGENLVLAMAQQLGRIEALAASMANVTESSPKEADRIMELIPPLLGQFGEDSMIAGGGIWPEEFKFDANIRRRSFFWGRDQRGRFKFYDDYNQADGPGYHHEEWYVPTRLMPPNKPYWSRSYTDPYSLQPMVTCSSAIVNKGQFEGVATVDLMLNGVSKTLESMINRDTSYAFVVDRNHKFISFPDPKLVQTYRDIDGKRTPDYLNVEEFAKKEPRFTPIAEVLGRLDYTELFAATEMEQSYTQYIKDLEFASYQIDPSDARRIAAHIWRVQHNITDYPKLLIKTNLESDMILGEAVSLNVYSMPQTDWKVVTVFKMVESQKITNEIIFKIIAVIFLSVFVFGILAYLVLKNGILKRFQNAIDQLKTGVESESNDLLQIDYHEQDELGVLIHWLNQYSKQLAVARAQAQSANSSKSEFLAKMSHELRTPLNSIMGFSNRLIKRSQHTVDKAHLEALYAIYRNAVQQLELINDMLEHSAIESGLVRLKLEQCDANDVVNQVYQDCETLVKGKHLAFSTKLLEESLTLVLDRKKITQVLVHLVSNAVKATETGCISITIEKTKFHGASAVSFTVMDTGSGISDEDQKQLFNAFSQLKHHSGEGGSGLGLYLSKYFVEMHGGTIKVHTTVGGGACFSVVLPVAGPISYSGDGPHKNQNGA